MGRDKKANRVKGNLQPSSSARAADLLGNAPVFAIAPFGGAAAGSNGVSAGGSPRPPPALSSASSVFSSPGTGVGAFASADDFSYLDGDLKVIFKKLSKRDNVTRTKALEEFAAFVATNEAEAIAAMLPAWPKLYGKLSGDAERRIREATNTVHANIVRKVGKQLAPYLKSLIGNWLVAQFDPARETARIATEAFHVAFPTEQKQTGVLAYCQHDIVAFVDDCILHQTPETLSDMRFTPPEEMMSKYARIISACYASLSTLVERLPEAEREKESDAYNALLDDPRFWAMSSHDLPLIRRAVYNFIKTVCVNAPSLIESRLQTVSLKYLYTAFNDKDPYTHADMWDALLLFTKLFPSAYIYASAKKPILNKLFNFYKNTAPASMNVSYPSLLPLLGHLPEELHNASSGLYENLFPSLWKGFDHLAVDRSNYCTMLNACLESLVYLLIRACRHADTTIQHHLIDVELAKFIELILLPNASLRVRASSSAASKYFTARVSELVAGYVAKIGMRSSIPDALFTRIMDALYETAVSVIERKHFVGDDEDSVVSPAEYKLFCARLGPFLQSIVGEARSAKGKETERGVAHVVAAVDRIVADSVTLAAPGIMMDASEGEPTLSAANAELLSIVARDFSAVVFKPNSPSNAALQELITERIPVVLQSSGHNEALPYLLEIVITSMSVLGTSDTTLVRLNWERIIGAIFGLDGKNRLQVLEDVLRNLRLANLWTRFDFRHKQLDQEVVSLVLDRLGQADETAAITESIIANCLMFEQPDRVLSDEALAVIFGQFSGCLESAVEYFATHRGSASILGDSNILQMQARTHAIVKVLKTVFSQRNYVHSFPQKTLPILLSGIFELCGVDGEETLENAAEESPAKRKASSARKFSGNPNADIARADDAADDQDSLLTSALEAWREVYVGLREKWFSEDFVSLLVTCITENWRKRLLDVKSVASPHNFASQLLNLRMGDAFDAATKKRIVQALLLPRKTWNEVVEPFVFHDPLLAIVEPLVRLFREAPVAASASQAADKQSMVLLDVNGLSLYARLVLVVVEAIKESDVLEALDDKWLLWELLRFEVVVQDTLRLQAGIKLWNRSVAQTMGMEGGSIRQDVAEAILRLTQHSGLQYAAKMWDVAELDEAPYVQHVVMRAIGSDAVEDMDARILAKLLTHIGGSIDSATAEAWCKFVHNKASVPSVPVNILVAVVSVLRQMQNMEVVQKFVLEYVVDILGMFISLPAEASNVTNAGRCLVLLNELLTPLPDDDNFIDIEHIPIDVAVVFFDVLQMWLTSPVFKSSANKANDKDAMSLQVTATNIGFLDEILRAMAHLVGCVESEGVASSFWKTCYAVLETANTRVPERKVLFYAALRLFDALLEASESIAEIARVVKSINGGIYSRLLDMLIAEADRITPSQPHSAFQSGLARICKCTPETVLFPTDGTRCYNDLCKLLLVHNTDVQTVAYYLMRRLTSEYVQAASLRLEVSSSAGDDAAEETSEKLPAALVDVVVHAAPSGGSSEGALKFITSLSELKSIEGSGDEDAFATIHSIFGYLLAWLSLFDRFDDATFRLKSDLIRDLRDNGVLSRFLETVFAILGVSGKGPAFDLSKWDVSEYAVRGFVMINMGVGSASWVTTGVHRASSKAAMCRQSFALIAGHLYSRALTLAPTLVRLWWSECKNRQLTLAVESYTEKYFTPTLLAHEYALLQTPPNAAGQEVVKTLVVRLNKQNREVTLSYPIEETSLDMLVKLPRTFPLRQPEIVTAMGAGSSGSGAAGSAAAAGSAGGVRAGIPESKWRSWLLSSQSVLTAQNGSLLDAAAVFARNAQGHFENVEECAICYSVIGIDRTLPNKMCRTCKKLFHGGCLFKWFKTSNQSTCPLCRTVF